MQGDVLGPLLSSNMVENYIGSNAIKTCNYYMYKNKVVIPPLAMVDDTLGISVCGVKSNKMNSFLNTRTSLMNLQFGSDKCEKLHIGKIQNKDICSTLTIDFWKQKLVEKDGVGKEFEDTFVGKEPMKEVENKKYLGDIVSKNGTNTLNIKEKTNKAMGNVNKIVLTISERSYGIHTFKAAKLMREAIIISGLLTNSECWINLTKKNLDDLENLISYCKEKLFPNKGTQPSVLYN